jgi:hypothetical protein
MLITKKEKIQCWLALGFTCGELGICVWLIVAHLNFIYIWVFFAATLRESSGGQHYHEILLNAYKKVRIQKVHVDDNPFYKQ